MEFFKRMVREAVKESLPETKQKEDTYIFLSERLLHKHKFDDEMPYEGDIPESEWTAICKACFDVVKFKELKHVKKHLINDVISDAIRHCGSMESVNFNRATINGIELVFDEIDRLAQIYQAEVEDRQESTKFKIDELL